METIFKLKAGELDSKLMETIKNLFKDSVIEISIKSVQDETEYLLNSPSNKKHLLDAIKDVKKNKNLIRFTGKEFEELSAKLLSE